MAGLENVSHFVFNDFHLFSFIMEDIVKYIIHNIQLMKLKKFFLLIYYLFIPKLICALSFRLIKNNFSGLHKI